jgi:hypothetical protein
VSGVRLPLPDGGTQDVACYCPACLAALTGGTEPPAHFTSSTGTDDR